MTDRGLTVAAIPLADWLDEEQERRGLSDREFEVLTGYSRSSRRNLRDNPGAAPLLPTLVRLARALDKPVWWVVALAARPILDDLGESDLQVGPARRAGGAQPENGTGHCCA